MKLGKLLLSDLPLGDLQLILVLVLSLRGILNEMITKELILVLSLRYILNEMITKELILEITPLSDL